MRFERTLHGGGVRPSVDIAHTLPRGAVGVFSVPWEAGERALLPNIHLGSAVGRHPFLRFWPAAPDVVSDHIDGLRERNKEEEEVQSLEALGNRTETTAQIEIEMTEMPGMPGKPGMPGMTGMTGGTHISLVCQAAGKRFTSQYGRPVCQMT